MFEKMRQASKNATRIAAIFLFFSAIILGITTPSRADTTGNLNGFQLTSQNWGFNLDLLLTNVGADFNLSTENKITLNYSIPTPTFNTSVITLNSANSSYDSFRFTPYYGLQFNPTFNVTDNFKFYSNLSVYGLSQTYSLDIPDFSYGGVSFTGSGSGGLTGSSSGPSNFMTVATQPINSSTLWSLSGNVIPMLMPLPVVGGVAAALDSAGVYLSAGVGLSLQGTYLLQYLPYFNSDPFGVSIPIDHTPGIHTFSTSQSVSMLLSAYADYLYEGDLRFAVGQSSFGDIGSISIPTGLVFDPTNDGGLFAGQLLDLGTFNFTGSYIYEGGRVPLPQTSILLGSGLIGLAWFRRRKR